MNITPAQQPGDPCNCHEDDPEWLIPATGHRMDCANRSTPPAPPVEYRQAVHDSPTYRGLIASGWIVAWIEPIHGGRQHLITFCRSVRSTAA